MRSTTASRVGSRAIYAEAQGEIPDINYLIAIDTRYVGEAALARDGRAVLELAFRFVNSYLRAALNARAVRIAYNVMNQYRPPGSRTAPPGSPPT